jgi:hypothetical protein
MGEKIIMSRLEQLCPSNLDDPKNIFLFYFPGSADEDSGVGGSPAGGGVSSSSRPMSISSHGCSMCNKKFSRADILRKHVKTHVNSACTVCGKMFTDKVALAKHQVEVGQKSYLMHSDYRRVSPYWVLPENVQLIRAV